LPQIFCPLDTSGQKSSSLREAEKGRKKGKHKQLLGFIAPQKTIFLRIRNNHKKLKE